MMGVVEFLQSRGHRLSAADINWWNDWEYEWNFDGCYAGWDKIGTKKHLMFTAWASDYINYDRSYQKMLRDHYVLNEPAWAIIDEVAGKQREGVLNA